MKYFVFGKKGNLLYEFEKHGIDEVYVFVYDGRAELPEVMTMKEMARFLKRIKRNEVYINDDHGYIEQNGFWKQMEMILQNY